MQCRTDPTVLEKAEKTLIAAIPDLGLQMRPWLAEHVLIYHLHQ
jgi:hypothetical protein